MSRKVYAFESRFEYDAWLLQHKDSDYVVLDLKEPHVDMTEAQREEFIGLYIDAVAQLSKAQQSRQWWATNISSKNRFLSPLVGPLQDYYICQNLLNQTSAQHVVIINVSWALHQQLSTELKHPHIAYAWHGHSSRWCGQMLCNWMKRVSRLMAHGLKHAQRMYMAQAMFKSVDRDVLKQPYYVIKTFASAKSFIQGKGYQDTFFGVLPDFIQERRPLLIVADIMDDFASTSKLMTEYTQKKIYPLEYFLSLMDILKATLEMLCYRIHVPAHISWGKNNIAALIKAVCVLDGSKIQPWHYYHYYVMKGLLDQVHVSAFAFTCEYNPWERMCLLALNEHPSDVMTYGYQHTVVPQASMNMFNSTIDEDVMPQPKQLLTVGIEPAKIIEQYQTSKQIDIKPACGLRFEYLNDVKAAAQLHRRGHILVALEGLPDVARLIDVVISQLSMRDDLTIRIRTHPVLRFNLIMPLLKQNIKSLKHVELSDGSFSLAEDLLWADIVLYWGTTVSLEALSLGKPVIHFDNGSLISFDPLFKLDQLKWITHRRTDLSQLIDQIYNLSDREFNEQLKAAQQYLARYFHPVTPNAMEKFILMK